MFFKPKAKSNLEKFLHRYELRHSVSKNDMEVVHTYTFLAKGKQLPLLVTVRERQERGLFRPRAIRYESKNNNTLHTRHFNSLEKLICHLVVFQDKKDRMDHK